MSTVDALKNSAVAMAASSATTERVSAPLTGACGVWAACAACAACAAWPAGPSFFSSGACSSPSTSALIADAISACNAADLRMSHGRRQRPPGEIRGTTRAPRVHVCGLGALRAPSFIYLSGALLSRARARSQLSSALSLSRSLALSSSSSFFSSPRSLPPVLSVLTWSV